MVIDMNEAKLETIEQIQEFLSGTAEVTFSIPNDEPTLRAFVATVIKRFSYFRRRKGHRGAWPGAVLDDFTWIIRIVDYTHGMVVRSESPGKTCTK
jgi:hypothetical protein